MSLHRLLRIVLPLCAFALPQMAYAQINPCFTELGLPCINANDTPGAFGAIAYAQAFILPGARIAFFAAAIIFFFYYGIRLLIDSDEESTITEVKSAYGYGIAGAVFVSLAGLFADSFSDPVAIIEPAPIVKGISLVVNFIFLSVSIVMTAAIVYLGVRLIMLQGQESEIEQQKKRFFHGLLGVAIIILAKTVVNAFSPGDGSVILANEIAGIINFILTIFGALAVLAFVVAGMMLVLSTDDALKDRAKKSIFTAIVAIIVVFSALMIIRFVLML